MTKKKVVTKAKAKPVAKKSVKVPAKELDMFKKAGVKSIKAGGTQFDLIPGKATLKKKVVSHKNPRTGKTVTVDTKKAKIASSKSVDNTKKTQDAQFKAEVKSAKEMIAQQTKFHLDGVLAATGKVLQVDKDYCKDLGNRILAKKFPTLKLKM